MIARKPRLKSEAGAGMAVAHFILAGTTEAALFVES